MFVVPPEVACTAKDQLPAVVGVPVIAPLTASVAQEGSGVPVSTANVADVVPLGTIVAE